MIRKTVLTLVATTGLLASGVASASAHECFIANRSAQGIPLSVTMFERFTIPRSMDEFDALSAKSSDGKGVDHFFSTYGDALFQIFFTAQAS